jgi:hypothetical protein
VRTEGNASTQRVLKEKHVKGHGLKSDQPGEAGGESEILSRVRGTRGPSTVTLMASMSWVCIGGTVLMTIVIVKNVPAALGKHARLVTCTYLGQTCQ